MSLENMFLVALWTGKGKPHEDLQQLLKCFVASVGGLRGRPIRWTDKNGQVRTSKVFVVYFCADSPGAADVACVQIHSGTFGCRFCYHKGQNFMTVENFPMR